MKFESGELVRIHQCWLDKILAGIGFGSVVGNARGHSFLSLTQEHKPNITSRRADTEKTNRE